MRKKRQKRNNYLGYYIGGFIAEYKTLLLTALFFAAAGMVIGFIVAGKTPESFVQSNYLTQIKTEEYKIASGFFKFLIMGLVCLSLVYFNLFSNWLKILSWGILAFLGFKFAAAIVGLFAQAIFSGLLCLLLFYLPLYLCLILTVSIAYCLVNYQTCGCGRFLNTVTADCNKAVLKKFACLAVFVLACCLLFGLLIPSLYKLVVVF